MASHDPARLYWLDGPDGRILIRRGSLLLGRSPDCDVVLPDALVSRHHAVLRLDERGVEAVLLGRAPLSVNGAAVGASVVLREGDELSICGRSFRLLTTDAPPEPEPEIAWAITRRGAVHHRVKGDTFTVGGSGGDDLFVDGWPAAALSFFRAQRGLTLQASVAGVSCGDELAEGEVRAVLPGATVSFRGESVQVLALARDASAVTAPMIAPELPITARLLFLPKGGRLTLEFARAERTVWLPDRRCDLVAVLLKPPAPYGSGDSLPDDTLIPRVWPGGAGRTELNTLIFRARKDLLKADLDGGALLERTPGAVRFRLAERAAVTVGS